MRQSLMIPCLALLVFASATLAQTAPAYPRPLLSPTNLIPPVPVIQSPVAYFRQLLLMSPAELGTALTNRTTEGRARIMAKITEYQALDPNERELRLRATELRWYLVPLMGTDPTNREPQLARVPVELQDLVKSRLKEWDILPPALQKEFLANDRTTHYFAQTAAPAPADPRRQQDAEEFEKFFVLMPREKDQLLRTLSAPERAQMEKTLKMFEALPPAQRTQCVRNYAKFAGMSSAERSEFLKNAENWSKMSPQERQAWRDLVDHVPPWPPVPPEIYPPTVNHRVPPSKLATN